MKTFTKERNILLTACIIGLATPLAVTAEETPTDQSVSLEPVVVTATRTEKTVTNAPGSVSVVSKQDIDERHIDTVDQALNTTAGVYDNNAGKGLLGTTSSVSIRGLGYDKRVLFMLDGIPINDGYTGAVSYQLLSLEDIKQIEVVKGGASSLYGGNAMSGVVNIITRMPEKQEITLKTGYGSSWERGTALDDLTKIYASYGNKVFDKLSFLVGYGYRETNGYPTGLNVQSKDPATYGLSGAIPTTTNTGLTRYVIGDTGDNTWWDDQLTLKGALDLSKTTKATVSFLRSRYEYGYDTPHTYLRDASGNEAWGYSTIGQSSFLISAGGGRTQNMYGATFQTEFSRVLAKLSLGYLDRTDDWYISPSTTAATLNGGPGSLSTTPSSGYTGDLQFTIPAGERQIITAGGSIRGDQADNKNNNLSNWQNKDSVGALTYAAGGKDRTYSLYLQDEISILKNLTAYLGAREDWWEGFDGYANSVGTTGYPISYANKDQSSLSPKVALVYKPFDATTVRGSVGKAFRAPSVYDLYRTWTSTTGTTYNANPDLSPETDTTWEAGVEQGLWRRMKVKATFFDIEMEDMIYRKTVSATQQDNINAGKARSRGVELEAEQGFDFGLTLFANYTYNETEMLENAAAPLSVGKQLIQAPRNMFNAGARYKQGPFTTSVTGRYVGKRFGSDTNTDVINGVYTSYDPYTVVDAKVSYQINPIAEVALSVDNIFNENYFGYYQAPGRSFFCELTFRY